MRSGLSQRWLVSAALGAVVGVMTVGGCAGGPEVDAARCQFVRHEDMCEATVTLDPREADDPGEATTLEIKWRWIGKEVSDVPDRVVQLHLTAKEARSLGEAIDDAGKSRCVVEQAVEPSECVGLARIVSVEAEP